MTARAFLLAAALLLWVCALGAEYPTAFKDSKGASRTYHAESRYRLDAVMTLEGEKPHHAGLTMHAVWDAREKVLSVRNGAAELSYELISGKEQGEALGEIAEESPEDAKYEGEMEPLTVTYTRVASGKATKIKCTKGELPYSTADGEFAGALGPFMALAFPFGHGLVFPRSTGEDGDSWSEERTITLSSPDGDFPVNAKLTCRIDGTERVGDRECLVVTCTVAGKRGPGLQEWEIEGETVAIIIGGAVDGKITYYFDPLSGTLQRADADLTASLEMKQEGQNAKITEKLATRIELTDAKKK
ncbi:MAG: hypothetical protein ACYDCO_14130 [Armatimonadota bacterium]